jgi:maltose 6'-phosphate phosphatase
MRKTVVRRPLLVVLTLLLLLPAGAAARAGDTCGTGGYLKIMTLNLLFLEVQHRDERLAAIADYMLVDDVDVVLLQEVVGGALSGTFNSALDLKTLLAEGGGDYDLSYRMANGLPGLLTVGNAILSRCPIRYTVARRLPFVSEVLLPNGIEIPLKRKVMMSRIKVGRWKSINVYNTHLCAFCSPEGRLSQVAVASDFVKDVEALIPGRNPIIFGGDLNAQSDSGEYAAFTDGLGLLDTYAAVNSPLDPMQCDPTFDCTFDTGGDDYDNPYTDDPPVRIDYIFTRGLEPFESAVVFNGPDGFVSDHSAVVTWVEKP